MPASLLQGFLKKRLRRKKKPFVSWYRMLHKGLLSNILYGQDSKDWSPSFLLQVLGQDWSPSFLLQVLGPCTARWIAACSPAYNPYAHVCDLSSCASARSHTRVSEHAEHAHAHAQTHERADRAISPAYNPYAHVCELSSRREAFL
jgi:hypothetical protein